MNRIAKNGTALPADQVADVVAQACPAKDYRDKKVLLIVPDGTRTAPVGLLFQTLFRQIGDVTKNFDILIALGTHQPMSEAAICQRLDISEAQRSAVSHDFVVRAENVRRALDGRQMHVQVGAGPG